MSSAEGPVGSATESVGDFARRCGLELLRFAYLLTGDRQRAEDLVQDVLLAMYRRFGDELGIDNPAAYARRALVNANVSWARRASSREVLVDRFDDPAERANRGDTGAVSAHGAYGAADRDSLFQGLQGLPARQRSVLVLRFYVDLSDADIAELLGCRRATVRSLAARGLAALRNDPMIIEGDRA